MSHSFHRAASLMVVTSALACGAFVQPSVRRWSVDCSPSRAYYITDLLIAAGTAAAASLTPQPRAEFYIPTAVFGTSALVGIYKRHNCVQWRSEAPPEEWARVAELRRREAEEARARAEAETAQAAQAAQAAAQAQAAMAAAQPSCPSGFVYDGSSGLCVSSTPAAPPSVWSVNSVDQTSNTTINSNTTIVVAPAPADPHARNPAFHAAVSQGGRLSCQVFDDGTPNPGANMSACSRWCLPYLTARAACSCEAGPCR